MQINPLVLSKKNPGVALMEQSEQSGEIRRRSGLRRKAGPHHKDLTSLWLFIDDETEAMEVGWWC